MKNFFITDFIKSGWQLTEKHLWFVIRLTLIGFGFSIVSDYINRTSDMMAGSTKMVLVFSSIGLAIISILLHIGFVKFGLRLIDGDKSRMKELLSYQQYFWSFFFVSILGGLIAGAAFLLGAGIVFLLGFLSDFLFGTPVIILPVVITAGLIMTVLALSFVLRFAFGAVIVVDQGLGPIKALKKSFQMTKGLYLKLIGFLILAAFINLVGFLCVFIGLLISVPVTFFAYLYFYRFLQSGTIAPIKQSPIPTGTPYTPPEVPVYTME